MSRRVQADAIDATCDEATDRLERVLRVGHVHRLQQADIAVASSKSSDSSPKKSNDKPETTIKRAGDHTKKRMTTWKGVVSGFVQGVRNEFRKKTFFNVFKKDETDFTKQRIREILGSEQNVDEFKTILESAGRIDATDMENLLGAFVRDSDSKSSVLREIFSGPGQDDDTAKRLDDVKDTFKATLKNGTLTHFHFDKETCLLELLACLQSPVAYCALLRAGEEMETGVNKERKHARYEELRQKFAPGDRGVAHANLEKAASIYYEDFKYLRDLTTLFVQQEIGDRDKDQMHQWCAKVDQIFVNVDAKRAPFHRHIEDVSRCLDESHKLTQPLGPDNIRKRTKLLNNRITQITHDTGYGEVDAFIATDGVVEPATKLKKQPDGSCRKSVSKEMEVQCQYKEKNTYLDPLWRSRAVTMFRLFCGMLEKSVVHSSTEEDKASLYYFINMSTRNFCSDDNHRHHAFHKTVAYNIMCDETPGQKYVRRVFAGMTKFFKDGAPEYYTKKDAMDAIDAFNEKYMKFDKDDLLIQYSRVDAKSLLEKETSNKFAKVIYDYIDVLMILAFVKDEEQSGFSWFATSSVCPLIYAHIIQSAPLEVPYTEDADTYLTNTMPYFLTRYFETESLTNAEIDEDVGVATETWSQFFVSMGRGVTQEFIDAFQKSMKYARKHPLSAISRTMMTVAGSSLTVAGIAISLPFLAEAALYTVTYIPTYLTSKVFVQVIQTCSPYLLGIAWAFAHAGNAMSTPIANMGFVNAANIVGSTVFFGGQLLTFAGFSYLLLDVYRYMNDQPAFVSDNIHKYMSYAIASLRLLRREKNVPTVVFKDKTGKWRRTPRSSVLPTKIKKAERRKEKASSSSDMDMDEMSDDDTGGPSVPDETGEGDVAVWSEALQPNTAMPESSVTEECDRLWCHEAMDK